MGQAMADALRTALDKSHNGKQDKRAGAEKLVEMAGGGNLEATKLLFERTNGKVPEMRIHVGDDGAPPIRYVEVGDWRSGARAGRRGSSSRSGPTGASGSTSTRDRRGLGVARHASWPSWPVCSIMNRGEVRPSGPIDGARRGEALHQDHPAFAVAEQTGGGARLALTVGPPRSGNRPTRALQETGWVRVEPNAFRVALRGYAFYSPAKGIVWAAELAIRAFPVSGHAVVINATNTTRHRRARWLRIPATSGRRQRPSGWTRASRSA